MNQTECFHCGDPAPGTPPIMLEVDGETRRFCCHGCKAVCETIRAEGLTGFYQHRTAPAVTPKSLTAAERERILELDHPLAQKAFVTPVRGGLEAQLLIGGITCAACIWLLEHHLARQPGVLAFSVNHSTQRARLVWSPDQVSLSQLLIAIHELGYSARPYQPDEAEQRLQAERRSALIRLCVAGLGAMQSMMLAVPLYFQIINDLSAADIEIFRWFSLLVATPVVLYSARPFFSNALRDLSSRHLTMDVPVALAIGLAYVASAWVTLAGGEDVYFESVCMFTFFLSLGRYIEMQARYRAGLTGSALGGAQPAVAVLVEGTTTRVVAAHEIEAGQQVRIKPGGTAPVDGIIVEGRSTLNEAALTGEYLPEERGPGDQVHAGSINGENPLTVRALRTGTQTRLAGILRILDQVQAEKAPVARMADRVAGVFVSRLLIIAPLVWIGWWLAGADNAFDILLSVLVVTCPCALSLATPTAVTSATMRLRNLGFLPTRGDTLEALGTLDTVVFDKTGTLTRGELTLVDTECFDDQPADRCRALAAGLEQFSEHPIAKAFSDIQAGPVSNVSNILGQGLSGLCSGDTVLIGHRDFIQSRLGTAPPGQAPTRGIELWLASGTRWLARFTLDDQIREDAAAVVCAFQSRGMRTLLLSGDRSVHVAEVAAQLGIDEAIGEATPEQKLASLQRITDAGGRVMMVGDGLNDLPSMAGAGVSVAMDSSADLTRLSADAVLLNGQLQPLVSAVDISLATRRIIRQNMTWAIAYNVCALPLASAGFIPPWLAAIGMSVSSLLVVLNALRLGRTGTRSTTRGRLDKTLIGANFSH